MCRRNPKTCSRFIVTSLNAPSSPAVLLAYITACHLHPPELLRPKGVHIMKPEEARGEGWQACPPCTSVLCCGQIVGAAQEKPNIPQSVGSGSRRRSLQRPLSTGRSPSGWTGPPTQSRKRKRSPGNPWRPGWAAASGAAGSCCRRRPQPPWWTAGRRTG